VNPSPAELDAPAAKFIAKGSTAEPIAGLEHQTAEVVQPQFSRGGNAGKSTAYDDYVVTIFHCTTLVVNFVSEGKQSAFQFKGTK
jgi:hypothetical protein